MVTLYTGDKLVEITYSTGKTATFTDIAGIGYRPGKILIVWKDYTTEQVDNPTDIYKRISCPGRFDIDIE
jgi:hypothetical protein